MRFSLSDFDCLYFVDRKWLTAPKRVSQSKLPGPPLSENKPRLPIKPVLHRRLVSRHYFCCHWPQGEGNSYTAKQLLVQREISVLCLREFIEMLMLESWGGRLPIFSPVSFPSTRSDYCAGIVPVSSIPHKLASWQI